MPKQTKQYSKRITIRLQPKLLEAISHQTISTGQSVASTIREVLANHFGV